MSTTVIGINLSHDMSCAAVVDGEVAVAIEEERLTHIKHCDGKTHLGQMIPFASVRYCLDVLGIDARDVALWVANATSAAADRLLRERLLGIDPMRIREVPFPGHHFAHAASAFYPSPFHEAAVLVVDVNGSCDGEKKENYSIYRGSDCSLTLVSQEFVNRGEVGIGDLYTMYAAILQLSPLPDGAYGADDPHSSGGKLMGYAAYAANGTSHHRLSPFAELMAPSGDRFVIAIPTLVRHLASLGRIEHVIAEENLPYVFGSDVQHCVRWGYRKDSLDAPHNVAFAGEAQALLEESVVRMATLAHELTGCVDLCLAGGTTLNTAAAHRVLLDTPIRNLFVQPAANDAGTALGAALYGYYRVGSASRRCYIDKSYDTYLGRDYATVEIEAALVEPSATFVTATAALTEAEQIERLAQALEQDCIVAVFRGRSEFGPRALGNRSLLASPHDRRVVERMNTLKRREWYRPLAPVVPQDELDQYFDAPFHESPFMTINARCRPETLGRAPAICHVDGSARVQTVSMRSHAFLYTLLKRFAAVSGRPPILVNTSFNIGGPIVETPADAIRTLLAANGAIHHLLLGDRLVSIRDQG